VTAIETTGSGLIAALEQTWADICHRTPELPEVIIVTAPCTSTPRRSYTFQAAVGWSCWANWWSTVKTSQAM
jgi:hypothetical protein